MTQRTYADLHLHTVASDGTQTVDELIRRAKASALHCIAVTDHDTLSPEVPERVFHRHGLEVIAGVEVKAKFGDIDGELLGYFVDPKDVGLRGLLEPLSSSRDERMRTMVALCRKHLAIEIEYEEIRAVAGDGNIGRPHLARVLMDKGVVDSLQEAFATLIGKGCPCYSAIDKPDFREAVRILKAAGGAVSVAHPCLMRVPDWRRFLGELKAAGVDALETVYPYDPASRNLSIDPRLLAAEVEVRGLLTTGGSDDHGPGSTKESLGTIRLLYRHVEALKQVAGV
jgi:hypothetical protein